MLGSDLAVDLLEIEWLSGEVLLYSPLATDETRVVADDLPVQVGRHYLPERKYFKKLYCLEVLGRESGSFVSKCLRLHRHSEKASLEN